MSSVINRFVAVMDEEEEKVIDSNDRVKECVDQYQKELIRRQEMAKAKEREAYLEQVTQDEEGNLVFPTDEEGQLILPLDSNGELMFPLDEEGIPILDGEMSSEEEEGVVEGEEGPVIPEEVMEEISAQADAILADANAQAEAILADAQAKGEAIRGNIEEEARKDGYQKGISQAMQEYEAKNQALEQEKAAYRDAYRKKEETMEKDLVSVITNVFEKAFLIQFSDKEEMILHLVDNAIMNIENSREFQIKVNEANFAFLSQYKEDLQKKVGEDVQLDIIMDPLLDQSQCIIETDGGVFDCSMGVELDSLIRDLKMLSGM